MIRILLAACLLVAGCAGQPTPFQTGVETPPPWGCIEYRKRGGKC